MVLCPTVMMGALAVNKLMAGRGTMVQPREPGWLAVPAWLVTMQERRVVPLLPAVKVMAGEVPPAVMVPPEIVQA
jgi:hypothetical protein